MKWIVFDYGNVISLHQSRADNHAIAELAGADPESFEQAYWEHRLDFDRGDLTAPQYWKLVLGRPVDEEENARLVELDAESWSRPNEGTLAIMRELQDRGVPLGLLSNAPAELAEAWDRLPWISALDRRFYSAHLGLVKPDRAIYDHLADELGTREIVFIDDRLENVEGAEKAGLTGVHFLGAAELRESLSLM
ncbi:HAD family phosphatase [Nonomuraea sp. NPDC050310]|uniref:HAD family hydrolase n=1 Tax=unclassified Nonomuraea TaxID=2593643 RepID=UPI00340B416A